MKAREGRATGLFYTAISRATTLGDSNGLNSAIYFVGPHLTRDRIVNLTLKANTTKSIENVKRRRAWVDILDSHTVVFPEEATQSLTATLQWVALQRIPYDVLYRRSQLYAQALMLRDGRFL